LRPPSPDGQTNAPKNQDFHPNKQEACQRLLSQRAGKRDRGAGSLLKLSKNLYLWRQREDKMSTQSSIWTHRHQLAAAGTHFREMS